MFSNSTLKAPLTNSIERSNAPAAAVETKQANGEHNKTDDEFLYKIPCSNQTYYVMRPAENVHIYLWLLKDLAWSQDWYWPALIFGTMALAWCAVLFYEAYRLRSIYEAYMTVGITMWLAANFVWMAGERCVKCCWVS